MKCHEIHIPCEVEYIRNLFNRAAPELLGGGSDASRRDRHAKTIEIAQEEVLTCIGICLFERLHRIQQRRCEEELSWDILFCVAVDALKKRFYQALEEKQGISQLELLCQEISQQEEKSKERKERLKVKKKNRKQRQRENKENVLKESEQEKCSCDEPNSKSIENDEDSTGVNGESEGEEGGLCEEAAATTGKAKTKKKNKKKREKKAAKQNDPESWSASPSVSPRHSPLKDVFPDTVDPKHESAPSTSGQVSEVHGALFCQRTFTCIRV